MNVRQSLWGSCAVALVTFGTALTANAAPLLADGLSAGVVPAQRFRAAQEGAAAIKLQTATLAAQVGVISTERDGVAANVAADLRAPTDKKTGDVRAPTDKVVGDVRAPTDKVVGDVRAPTDKKTGD